ncbi:unnamed protein product, partial [Polarella glacialis]
MVGAARASSSRPKSAARGPERSCSQERKPHAFCSVCGGRAPLQRGCCCSNINNNHNDLSLLEDAAASLSQQVRILQRIARCQAEDIAELAADKQKSITLLSVRRRRSFELLAQGGPG